MIEYGRMALIDGDMDAAQWVLEQEESFVDPVTDVLENFVNGLMRENLSTRQQKHCFQLKNLLTDVERVGDLTEDLAEAAQRKVNSKTEFSPAATQAAALVPRATSLRSSRVIEVADSAIYSLSVDAGAVKQQIWANSRLWWVI